MVSNPLAPDRGASLAETLREVASLVSQRPGDMSVRITASGLLIVAAAKVVGEEFPVENIAELLLHGIAAVVGKHTGLSREVTKNRAHRAAHMAAIALFAGLDVPFHAGPKEATD